MTKEQARDVAKEYWWNYEKLAYIDDDNVTYPAIAMPCYYDGFDSGWDAAIDHAAANQWTYLPELPRDDGWYLVTYEDGKHPNAVTELRFTQEYGWATLCDGSRVPLIAWRPLPLPAEIKRSEDEV